METHMMKSSVMEGRDARRAKGQIQGHISELLTSGTLMLEDLLFSIHVALSLGRKKEGFKSLQKKGQDSKKRKNILQLYASWY
jgi:hypothetical protein